MHFDVYCDESRPDLLASKKSQAKFMLIGSLWLPREMRGKYKEEIHRLRDRYKIGGEFKWTKISPSRRDFYLALADWFLSKKDSLRFRCIIVDQNKVNLKLYHQDDQELGFYKFYYQLLHHWILDFNDYSIFVDFKSNRRRDRLPVLKQCLDLSNLSSNISLVQAIRSEESVLIQCTDVLVGATAYRINNQINENSTKYKVLNRLEKGLGWTIKATSKAEQKFNVFAINLRGGW